MIGSSSSVVRTVSRLPRVKIVDRFLKVVRVEKKPRLGVSSAPIRSSFSATSSYCNCNGGHVIGQSDHVTYVHVHARIVELHMYQTKLYFKLILMANANNNLIMLITTNKLFSWIVLTKKKNLKKSIIQYSCTCIAHLHLHELGVVVFEVGVVDLAHGVHVL